MRYASKAWQEPSGPCLRNFSEEELVSSVQGALALRPQIEAVIDRIWEDGFDGIYFVGIGGTYASGMQVEVYMRGRSRLPVFVENAAEFLTTGNRRFTDRSVVVYSSVSGNTKEMVELVDRVREIGARIFAFIDTPGSILTQPEKQDYLILYPKNEQLKFYMVANYLMYKNGEFPQYEVVCKALEGGVYRPVMEEWADFYTILGTEMESIMKGKKSIDQGLADAQQQLEEMLRKSSQKIQ